MEDFFGELERMLRLGQIDDARTLCEGEPGLMPQVLLVGLDNRDEGVEGVKQILVDEVQVQAMPQLTKHLSVLGVIAKVAPMLGLLGTVFGMIAMFQEISLNPQFDVSDISRGIFRALGTTAMGLTVAIPVIFFHAYFMSRINNFELSFYKYLTRFLRILRRLEEVAGG
jgi:biopolymer transport protein ExbB